MFLSIFVTFIIFDVLYVDGQAVTTLNTLAESITENEALSSELSTSESTLGDQDAVTSNEQTTRVASSQPTYSSKSSQLTKHSSDVTDEPTTLTFSSEASDKGSVAEAKFGQTIGWDETTVSDLDITTSVSTSPSTQPEATEMTEGNTTWKQEFTSTSSSPSEASSFAPEAIELANNSDEQSVFTSVSSAATTDSDVDDYSDTTSLLPKTTDHSEAKRLAPEPDSIHFVAGENLGATASQSSRRPVKEDLEDEDLLLPKVHPLFLTDEIRSEEMHDLFINRYRLPMPGRFRNCAKCQRSLHDCVDRCFRYNTCERGEPTVMTCPKIRIPCFGPFKDIDDECESSSDCKDTKQLCCLIGCKRKCVQGIFEYHKPGLT